MSALIDLTGKRFGKLIVIEQTGSQHSHILWKCKCDCGNESVILGLSLRWGRTKSCGCLHKDPDVINNRRNKIIKHGHYRRENGKVISSKTYNSWASMKRRCNYPKHEHYYLYGGRGIKVCERWNDFVNFLKDMGERPGGMTLDRIDPNGNYEPFNCRWVTHQMQTAERRKEIHIKNLLYNTNEGFSIDISKQNNVFI